MPDYHLPLVKRELIADGTMAFWFDTTGSGLTFEAGQNADWHVIHPPTSDAEGNMRTFSFATAPEHQNTVMIATRMRDTAFKNWLRDMPLGTKIKMTGPLGDMLLHEDASRPAVFIAGGIGITPFRSMVEHAAIAKLPHKITLLYSNRTVGSSAFLKDLRDWQSINPNFKLTVAITDEVPADWDGEVGRIDAPLIERHVPDLKTPMWYLAGPAAMTGAMRELLKKLGVSRDNIRQEEFSGY